MTDLQAVELIITRAVVSECTLQVVLGEDAKTLESKVVLAARTANSSAPFSRPCTRSDLWCGSAPEPLAKMPTKRQTRRRQRAGCRRAMPRLVACPTP